jgi:TorA maturation chaperone TorD
MGETMSTKKEHIEIIFAGRSFLYQILQVLLGGEPDENILKNTVNRHSRDAFILLFDSDTPEVIAYLSCLGDIERELAVNASAAADKLKSEYTRLFIGPDALPAPPWESVYTTTEQSLFQAVTLEVRRAYYKYCFLPKEYPRVADDHIALELDFMHHLASMALDRFLLDDRDAVLSLIHDQEDFLRQHLLAWSAKFVEALQKANVGFFYLQTARYLDFFLKADLDILDELSSVLAN